MAFDQAFIRSGRFSTILAAAPDRYNSIVSKRRARLFHHEP